MGADENIEDQLLKCLPQDISALVEKYLKEEPLDATSLKNQVLKYLQVLESEATDSEFIDLELARHLGSRCLALLEVYGPGPSEQRLIQAAVTYFIEADDAEGDTTSPIGFDDDAIVVNEVSRILGRDAEATK